MNCRDFDELLDAMYGKVGSLERMQFEKEAKEFSQQNKK